MSDLSPWALPALKMPDAPLLPSKPSRYANGNRKIAPIFLPGSLSATSINTEKTLPRDKASKLKGKL